MEKPTQWYDSRENLRTLLQWMEENGKIRIELDDILYYLEKPWKWSPEWEEMQLTLLATNDSA